MLAVGVVVLAGAAGVGARWWLQEREYAKAAKPTEFQKQLSSTTNLSVTGDYDKAHQTVDTALDNPKLSADQKYSLYQQQGSIYESQGKPDEALESYKKAESFKETYYIAGLIAYLAEQKDDKEMAINYYKKAISLIPDSEMMKDSIIRDYKAAITRLGGQP